MKELEYKSIIKDDERGYRILFESGDRAYISKSDIMDLIIDNIKWFKCPNCGECFIKRYRQRSLHCSRCTLLTHKKISELSEVEQKKRRKYNAERAKKYRAKLKYQKKLMKCIYSQYQKNN